MSHDFAKGKNGGNGKAKKKSTPKNASKKTAEKKSLPGWFYFFSGVAVTLFAQLLIHLARVDQPVGELIEETAKEVIEEGHKTSIEFEFYDKLKQQEVEVSEEVVAEREQEDYNYVLQAGSFREKDRANQQRAEIMLLGLDANIEKSINAKGTWYRLIVGPFTSRSDLNRARSKLINNGMPTEKIKRDS